MTESILSRLQSLTGPDREIDGEIALAVGWTFYEAPPDCNSFWMPPEGGSIVSVYPPRFTASIDAALILLPKGYGYMLRYHEVGDGKMRACCSLLGNGSLPDTWDVWGETPAIALLIAIMRAREANAEA